MAPSTVARLQVIGAAALFSTGGAVIKAASFSAWQVACLRSGIAAAAILLLLPGARRNWNLRKLPVAAAYAVTLVAFVGANKLTTAANAIFLEDTAPLYLALAGPLLLHEPLRRHDVLSMALMAAGMALFFAGDQTATAIAPNPALGNLIGALTGFTWAVTVGGLRWLAQREPHGDSGMATVAMGNTLAFALALPLAWPLTGAPAGAWAAVAFLGIVQVGLAYVLLTRGIRGVPALEASLLILVEPALTPVWAGLVHGEWPGPLPLAGAALIFTATLLQLARRNRA